MSATTSHLLMAHKLFVTDNIVCGDTKAVGHGDIKRGDT